MGHPLQAKGDVLMRRTIMPLMVSAILLFGVVTSATAGQTATEVGDERFDYYQRVREGLGFPTEPDAIANILSEHGVSPENGFPMTPEEEKQLAGRLTIQRDVSDDVLELLWELEGYAGFYFDHKNGGAATLLVTDVAAAEVEARGILPHPLHEMFVVREAKHSWAELVEAADTLADAGAGHSVSVDVAGNGVKVFAGPTHGDVTTAENLVALVDVPVRIVEEAPSEPDTSLALHGGCNDRLDCHSPLRAGVQMRDYHDDSKSSLGFGIERYGDEQVLIVGHEGATHIQHPGLGLVGSLAASAFYENGVDAKAFYALDSEVSNIIYMWATGSREVIDKKYPSVGLYVCMSGFKTGLSCGNVVDNWKKYTFPDLGFKIIGASADYDSKTGDSGGPVYHPLPDYEAWAVGIHSSGRGDREFARMFHILNLLNGTLVTSS